MRWSLGARGRVPRLARRLAVDQARLTLDIEAQDPVADDLKRDPSNLSRIAAPTAVVDHG